MKKTLELAAEEYASYDNEYVPIEKPAEEHDFNKGYKIAFIQGAKWHQQQDKKICSDEKVIDLFITEIKTEFKDENWDYLDFIKYRLLEKFKNK
jgi:hypothetical protein